MPAERLLEEQLFLPLFDEVPELPRGSGGRVVFFQAYDSEEEMQTGDRLELDEGILGIDNGLLIVFLGYTDCKSDCFFGVFDGIVDGPVGPPRSHRMVKIAIFSCSYALHSCDQRREGVGKEHLAQCVAPMCEEGVSEPHGDCIEGARSWLPAIDFDLDYCADGTIGDDTLCAGDKRFYLLQFVPAKRADRAYSYGVRNFEYIVAVAESEQAVVGIPEGLLQFQLRVAFGIDIDCLSCVEVNTVRHSFGLEGYTVVVHESEGLIGGEECLLVDGLDAIGFSFGGMLTVFATYLAFAIHLRPHESGIVRFVVCCLYSDGVGLVLTEREQEREFVGNVIGIGVVALGRYFDAVHKHDEIAPHAERYLRKTIEGNGDGAMGERGGAVALQDSAGQGGLCLECRQDQTQGSEKG